MLTLWGGSDNPLHEYSCRQWSGIFNDFYRPRWEQFFTSVENNWGNFDQKYFDEKIKKWEWEWVNTEGDFPTEPSGNAFEIAKRLHDKYRCRIKPVTRVMPAIDYNY